MFKQNKLAREKVELISHTKILQLAFQAVLRNHDSRAFGLVKQILDSRHVGLNARFIHNQISVNAQDGISRCTFEIEANPEDANNYLHRARYYHILDDTENVRTDMERYRTILNPPKGTNAYKRRLTDLSHLQQNSHLMLGSPTNLGPPVNSSFDDWSPRISADGLELYFDSNRSGGFGSYDIWIAKRATADDIWSEPENLGPMVNGPDWEQTPRISADGLSLFFGSNRPEGSGHWDIWIATRETKDTEWSKAENLGTIINSIKNEIAPSISADGLSLFFGSNRPNGHGSSDLWLTTRETLHDDWSKPLNLGPPVNSEFCEMMSSISADGLMLIIGSSGFGPFRPDGFGKGDLWLATRATISDPWGDPVNLGPLINSPSYDLSHCIAADSTKLYICSNRSGGFGGFDIWEVSIVSPSEALQKENSASSSKITIEEDNNGKEVVQNESNKSDLPKDEEYATQMAKKQPVSITPSSK